MVTLVVPFIPLEEQKGLFPAGLEMKDRKMQEEHARNWLRNADLGEECDRLSMKFYDGHYHPSWGSIFPLGDLTALVPDEQADVCVLEEPEHLNWFRAYGPLWTDKFGYVVGIVHTNYCYYARKQSGGGIFAREIVRVMSAWMVRAYCHRVVKLSAALQTYAPEKEMVVNVHGVRSQFLEVGDRGTPARADLPPYFIGKSLWSKGFEVLLPLLRSYKRKKGQSLRMDIYGSGPDREAIEASASRYSLNLTFHDGIDHVKLTDHSIMINASKSEVLCTTVAEALAMGKWVICARHPSNEFFYQFPNCLPFAGRREFIACVDVATQSPPEPLLPEHRRLLTWEAATERFVDAISALEVDQDSRDTFLLRKPQYSEHVDQFLGQLHMHLSRGKHGDVFRWLSGAGGAAKQSEFTNQTSPPDLGQEEDRMEVEEDNGQDVARDRTASLAESLTRTLSFRERSLLDELCEAQIEESKNNSFIGANAIKGLVSAFHRFRDSGFKGLLKMRKEEVALLEEGEQDGDLASPDASVLDDSESVSSLSSLSARPDNL
jgi:digalactosyldiacylglycerol synthase